MSDGEGPMRVSASPEGAELLGYIEEMLLEMAHLAAGGGETALAATLAVAAIQCGGRLRAATRRPGEVSDPLPAGRPR